MDLDIRLGKQETEIENPDDDLEKEFANQMKSVGMNLKELQSDDGEDEENEIDSPKVMINVWLVELFYYIKEMKFLNKDFCDS